MAMDEMSKQMTEELTGASSVPCLCNVRLRDQVLVRFKE
jgi:hypothetical protein